MPDLNIDGPHSPDNTREAAALLPEVTRFLNHATGNHAAAALEFPSDVNSVVGNLASMAAHLPQLLGQLTAWLQNQNAAGRIYIDHAGRSRSRGSDPTSAVTEAAAALLDATGAAGRLYDALTLAHRFTNTMGARDD